MARPLRLQFPEGHYHVISRGNERGRIFIDDRDRYEFLSRLGRISRRLDWQIFAYCLMDNHYHLFVATPGPTLARGMQNLNGSYAQMFNRRHDRVGHLFQGRYTAIIVESSGYLLELVRYIVLNPVRAGLCRAPIDWPWSSHGATLGLRSPIPQLAVDAVLGTLDPDCVRARKAYSDFINRGRHVRGITSESTNPAFLGSETFVAAVSDEAARKAGEIPRRERASRPLWQYLREMASRNEAIRAAYASGAYSLAEIGRFVGLHYSTVSKICRDTCVKDSQAL